MHNGTTRELEEKNTGKLCLEKSSIEWEPLAQRYDAYLKGDYGLLASQLASKQQKMAVYDHLRKSFCIRTLLNKLFVSVLFHFCFICFKN